MKKIILGMMILTLAILFAACSNEDAETSNKDEANAETTDQDKDEAKEPEEQAEDTVKAEDIEISDEIKDMTYSTIEGYEGVKDAYIEVNENEITMTIQVAAS
ncbi:hypothetical protein [Sediminibacillus albus]|uniref:Uncharacterized protein n=1 Tax=Sediminibacillus albus TaxID=407036 RepID=A0A1G9B952_9BACI|nr:hypothetical protein [Sediminibacillus albus]SDK35999.1 hypothetical protein SAMN05216243_2885 [Sediminibacillus albus]